MMATNIIYSCMFFGDNAIYTDRHCITFGAPLCHLFLSYMFGLKGMRKDLEKVPSNKYIWNYIEKNKQFDRALNINCRQKILI